MTGIGDSFAERRETILRRREWLRSLHDVHDAIIDCLNELAELDLEAGDPCNGHGNGGAA